METEERDRIADELEEIAEILQKKRMTTLEKRYARERILGVANQMKVTTPTGARVRDITRSMGR